MAVIRTHAGLELCVCSFLARFTLEPQSLQHLQENIGVLFRLVALRDSSKHLGNSCMQGLLLLVQVHLFVGFLELAAEVTNAVLADGWLHKQINIHFLNNQN